MEKLLAYDSDSSEGASTSFVNTSTKAKNQTLRKSDKQKGVDD